MALPEQRRSTMAPERWEPARDFEQVMERMRHLLEDSFDAVPIGDGAPWLPLVDIEETDDAYVVEAELPGVKREDVNIELVGRELTVTGELKERERAGILRRRTRRVGRFEYRVSLPADVDGEKIEAHLDKGVLTIRVPRAQREQRRKIEVKS